MERQPSPPLLPLPADYDLRHVDKPRYPIPATSSALAQDQHPSLHTRSEVQNPKPLLVNGNPEPTTASLSSDASSAPQQPIKDAVDTAFDQSSLTQPLDPDFMRRLTEQVTEQVIRNLQAANLGGQAPGFPLPQVQATSTSADKRSPLEHSTGSLSSNASSSIPVPRAEYNQQSTPDPALSSDAFARGQVNAVAGKGVAAWTSQSDVTEDVRRSRTKTTGQALASSQERFSRDRDNSSSPQSIRESKQSTPFESIDAAERSRSGKAQVECADEVTTLERIWQPLFDNGTPTKRLGQFLRGVAKHVIDDYEPRGGLVIPPAKLLRFLGEAGLNREHYPWQTILGGKMSSNSISMMYRKLLCQHHLVQQQVHEVPSVPALTPSGFETFMKCLIQAHPDTEFERFAKVVKHLPISNADDCKERFPKELSRRLFPSQPNVPAEQRLISSLNHEPVLVRLERGSTAMPPPPPRNSAVSQQSSVPERERKPYARSSQTADIEDDDADDDDIGPPTVPLERERKPYYAKEGSGKRYDTEDDRGRKKDPEREDSQAPRLANRISPSKTRPESFSAVPPHSNPGSPSERAYKSGPTEPVNVPARKHRLSNGAQPTYNGTHSNGSRRSPPPSRAFARSEPGDISNVPRSQYNSNPYAGQPRDRYGCDADDDSVRFNRRRSTVGGSRLADNDTNNRPPPSQNTQMSGSSYDLLNGYPPRTAGGNAQDERIRPLFSGSLPGTDGYGSYMPNGGPFGSAGP